MSISSHEDQQAHFQLLSEPLWQEVKKDWSNEGAHQALIVLASETGQLGELARLYRQVAEDPSRADDAQIYLDKITAQALALLQTQRRSETPSSRGKNLTAFFICCGVIAGVFLALQLF
ncbi:MAG: hypothetical protein MK135_02615 [Polyangiaceae bacterium]|nr:hypothetical protein [Polyangiaceae bacterium]